MHKITDPSIPMYLSNYRIKGLSKVNISNDNGTILHSFLATTTVSSLSYLPGGTSDTLLHASVHYYRIAWREILKFQSRENTKKKRHERFLMSGG